MVRTLPTLLSLFIQVSDPFRRFVDNRTEFIYQLEFPLDTCSKLITLWIDPGSMAPSVTNIRIVARREEFQVTVAWRKLPIPFEAFDVS